MSVQDDEVYKSMSAQDKVALWEEGLCPGMQVSNQSKGASPATPPRPPETPCCISAPVVMKTARLFGHLLVLTLQLLAACATC